MKTSRTADRREKSLFYPSEYCFPAKILPKQSHPPESCIFCDRFYRDGWNEFHLYRSVSIRVICGQSVVCFLKLLSCFFLRGYASLLRFYVLVVATIALGSSHS